MTEHMSTIKISVSDGTIEISGSEKFDLEQIENSDKLMKVYSATLKSMELEILSEKAEKEVETSVSILEASKKHVQALAEQIRDMQKVLSETVQEITRLKHIMNAR